VVTYLADEVPVWSGEVDYEEKYTGTLYITNRRILFEHKLGRIRKRDILGVEVPLRDITSTSIERGPWAWTVLIIAANGQKHRFLFSTTSPESLVRRISELMTGQKA
jgi:hypothetical protein